MKRLFGTDGIRGVAGRPPLTASEVRAIGRAAGRVLRSKGDRGDQRMLAVRDTRESGRGLIQSLSEGLRETGVHVFDGGVISTPAAAFLVREHRFDSGVVISASHNPPEFNGIKFFTHAGRKWPDEWERLVEKLFSARHSRVRRGDGRRGELVDASSLRSDYEDFLAETIQGADFSGLRVALDCSHGANAEVAPRLFRRLGATTHVIGASPNGKNINVGCGSQHPERLARLGKEKRCHLGIAFDGDGDRVILVEERGAVVDGDGAIALLAKRFKDQKRLKKSSVVITVMANLGLKKALSRLGIRAVQVQVGDRYVSAAMQKHGIVLGGEQSGHIILGEYLPTGDGLLTSLHVAAAMKESGKPLSALVGGMKKYPQVLLNVPVKEKVPLDELDSVPAKIEKIERALGSEGRVLVRYSGTEPLLRIMLEGPDKAEIERHAKEIANAVRNAGS